MNTTIGVLGGMSWESTALYYRLANELVREARGSASPLASADLLVRSLDFAGVRELQLTDGGDEAAELLRREGLALADGERASCWSPPTTCTRPPARWSAPSPSAARGCCTWPTSSPTPRSPVARAPWACWAPAAP